MGKVIRTDGTELEILPLNGKVFDLDELQGVVSGYIEIVNVGRKYMVLNEEGKLNGFEINSKATEIFQKHYGMTDVIVGDVLIADENEIE